MSDAALNAFPGGNPLRHHWSLDPRITFLNHGSFGACPARVLGYQQELRERLEAEPVRFFVRECPGLLEAARAALASFLGADPEELAFVTNATTGVNTVLRSWTFSSGDELLTTDHEYNACRNVLDHVAAAAGARVVVARIPFPCPGPGAVLDALLAAATPRTRFLLVDHVTSPTGLVFPIERIAAAFRSRGVEVLVDGAHAPGMVPLDLRALGDVFYTGNAHKWLCAPKGAAFLRVPRAHQPRIRPQVISHGANTPPVERSRFRLEFDWTGTGDPTPFLAVPEALRFMASLVPGGWPEVMRRNRALALEGRRILSGALDVPPAAPEEMIGSLAAVPLPPAPEDTAPDAFHTDPLQDRLYEDHAIEVPIVPWPAPGRRLVRISAQLYNDRADYERLAAALRRLLRESPGTVP